MKTIRELVKYRDREDFLNTWYRDRSYLTAAHLKYVAIITMLLSHLSQSGYLYYLGLEYYQIAGSFTLIGRIAMPIFCFFTVQAIIFTKDYKKYFSRMLIFALISEIPFNLVFSEMLFDPNKQNVIFTLLIGALSIYMIDRVWKSDNMFYVKLVSVILIIFLMPIFADVLRTDYGSKGVLAIILMYFARNSKILTALSILIGFYFEFIMPGGFIPITYGFVYLSIPLILLYNAQIGKQNKWLFYIFYPAHLIIIYLLKILLI